MAEATNEQMQSWASNRTRPLAELMRKVIARCVDDRASIEDVYDRADGTAWTDTRDDVPHRMTNQDFLVHNTIAEMFKRLIYQVETGTQQQIADQRAAIVAEIRSNWNSFMGCCVRSVDS